jgi:potassium uptake TrkH family protein
MLSIDEQLNQLLLKQRQQARLLLRLIAGLAVLVSLGLIVFRYGFYLNNQEHELYHYRLNVALFVFVLVYSINLLFQQNRLQSALRNSVETALVVIGTIHGILGFLFNINLTAILLNWGGSSMPYLHYDYLLTVYTLIFVGVQAVRLSTKLSNINVEPATLFIGSFLLLILLGTLLLLLPAMSRSTEAVPFVTALFTSVSASCVTGLIVVDTGTYFSTKGQFVILLLFQIGGIGIVSFATFFATFLSKGVGLKHQSMIKDFLSTENLLSAQGLLRKVIVITLSIELAGAFIIFLSWDENLQFNSVYQKIFFSIFHSVSAFCNAGFSLFPQGLETNMLSNNSPLFKASGNVIEVNSMYNLHLSIALLIILGSIGFNTIEDVFAFDKQKNQLIRPVQQWQISTKIAVYSTGILILIGFLTFTALEIYQLTDRTIVEAFITTFFQSVTLRTAGFNTIDLTTLKVPTIIMSIFLMFIGASPGGTGGGIKSTTFYIIALSAWLNIKGLNRIEIGKRTIPDQLVGRAYSIFIFATTYNLIAVFLLSITEANTEGADILTLLFEQISAFSTVGLSLGITSSLTTAGKFILIVTMYIGRVGTITLALALSEKVLTTSYRYPDGYVMVG